MAMRGRKREIYLTHISLRLYFYHMSPSEGSVTSISIKTGFALAAGTDCDVKIKICDIGANCCTTANLDNQGDDMVVGEIDEYTDLALLGQCATVIISVKQSVQPVYLT